MPNIFTLTLNPALDVSTSVSEIVPLHKLRCAAETRSPGGGGINVARALHRLGRSAKAVFPAGGATGVRLQNLLLEEGLDGLPVTIAAETREDFAVFENKTSRQFRFVLPGPMMSEHEWTDCIDTAFNGMRDGDFLVASGSLPPNVPPDLYRRIAARATAIGARLVLDCPSGTLQQSLDAGVDIIKPSFSEFVELTGVSPLEKDQALVSIRALISSGQTNAVALTLGERGAWFVGKDFAFAAKAPSVPALSTIGAGDSFLAGLVFALAFSLSPQDALRTAVAAGTAALLAPGVELCRKADVDRLIPEVQIEALA